MNFGHEKEFPINKCCLCYRYRSPEWTGLHPDLIFTVPCRGLRIGIHQLCTHHSFSWDSGLLELESFYVFLCINGDVIFTNLVDRVFQMFLDIVQAH